MCHGASSLDEIVLCKRGKISTTYLWFSFKVTYFSVRYAGMPFDSLKAKKDRMLVRYQNDHYDFDRKKVQLNWEKKMRQQLGFTTRIAAVECKDGCRKGGGGEAHPPVPWILHILHNFSNCFKIFFSKFFQFRGVEARPSTPFGSATDRMSCN